MSRFDLMHAGKFVTGFIPCVFPHTYLVHLSTVDDSKISYPSWVNIQSAGWVNIQSALTAVMLNPEQHLRLDQKPVILDSMGIRRDGDSASRGEEFKFIELIGYDRRDWTVTMVRCSNLQMESFAERLDKAYRKLVI